MTTLSFCSSPEHLPDQDLISKSGPQLFLDGGSGLSQVMCLGPGERSVVEYTLYIYVRDSSGTK